ncbi:MAG: hypothetical protein ABIC68_05645 [Candidatus Omnitrophota bacterium]
MGFEADPSGIASSEDGRLRRSSSECEAGEKESLPAGRQAIIPANFNEITFRRNLIFLSFEGDENS